MDNSAGRAFRPQASPPRPGLAAICVSSASWAVSTIWVAIGQSAGAV